MRHSPREEQNLRLNRLHVLEDDDDGQDRDGHQHVQPRLVKETLSTGAVVSHENLFDVGRRRWQIAFFTTAALPASPRRVLSRSVTEIRRELAQLSGMTPDYPFSICTGSRLSSHDHRGRGAGPEISAGSAGAS